MVLDGKPVAEHDWIGAIAVHPTGQGVAYWAGDGVRVSPQGPYTGGRDALRWGRREIAAVAEHGDYLTPPAFTPNGNQLAYFAPVAAGTRHLVAPGKHYAVNLLLVEAPVFARDGSQVRFAARRGRDVWSRVLVLP